GVTGTARDVDLRERRPALDVVADLRVEHDPRPEIDGIALLLASGAEMDRADPDALRGDGRDVRGPRRGKALDARRARETRWVVDHAYVAALRDRLLPQLRQAATLRPRALGLSTPRRQ